jgi:hypothetical protein
MIKLTYSHRLHFLCACTRWHALRSLAERHAVVKDPATRAAPRQHIPAASDCHCVTGAVCGRRGAALPAAVVGSYQDAVGDDNMAIHDDNVVVEDVHFGAPAGCVNSYKIFGYCVHVHGATTGSPNNKERMCRTLNLTMS